MSENIPKLVTAKTDADVAREFREEIRPVLAQAAEIVGRARAMGFILNFSVGPDQYGRIQVGEIGVVKPL